MDDKQIDGQTIDTETIYGWTIDNVKIDMDGIVSLCCLKVTVHFFKPRNNSKQIATGRKKFNMYPKKVHVLVFNAINSTTETSQHLSKVRLLVLVHTLYLALIILVCCNILNIL